MPLNFITHLLIDKLLQLFSSKPNIYRVNLIKSKLLHKIFYQSSRKGNKGAYRSTKIWRRHYNMKAAYVGNEVGSEEEGRGQCRRDRECKGRNGHYHLDQCRGREVIQVRGSILKPATWFTHRSFIILIILTILTIVPSRYVRPCLSLDYWGHQWLSLYMHSRTSIIRMLYHLNAAVSRRFLRTNHVFEECFFLSEVFCYWL